MHRRWGSELTVTLAVQCKSPSKQSDLSHLELDLHLAIASTGCSQISLTNLQLFNDQVLFLSFLLRSHELINSPLIAPLLPSPLLIALRRPALLPLQ